MGGETLLNSLNELGRKTGAAAVGMHSEPVYPTPTPVEGAEHDADDARVCVIGDHEQIGTVLQSASDFDLGNNAAADCPPQLNDGRVVVPDEVADHPAAMLRSARSSTRLTVSEPQAVRG